MFKASATPGSELVLRVQHAVIASVLTFLVTAPVAFGGTGRLGLLAALGACLLAGFRAWTGRGLAGGFAGGLIATAGLALSVMVLTSFPIGPLVVTVGGGTAEVLASVLTALAWSGALALSFEFAIDLVDALDGTPARGFRWKRISGLAAGAVLVFFTNDVVSGWPGSNRDPDRLWLGVSIMSIRALCAGVGLVAGYIIGGRFGWYLGNTVRRGVIALLPVGPYLLAMLMPMLGFMVVYLAIVLVSAGYFASAYRLDAVGAFGTEAKDVHPGFWDFAYLSLMTITTLGYSDLRPSSAATKLVASLEVAAGIGWLAVGLAGIIAYLDRRFDQVSKAQARRPPGRRRKPAQKRPLPKGPDVSASANDRRSGSERSTVG